MRTFKMGWVITILICVSFSAYAQEETFTLRYQVDPEKSLNYELDGTSQESFRMDESTLDTRKLFEMDFMIRPLKQSFEDTLNVTMSFLESKFTVRVNGRLFYPDGTLMTGYEQVVRLDSHGTIINTPEIDRFPRITMSQGDNTGTNFGYTLKDFFIPFPEESISVGGEWELTEIDTIVDGGRTNITEIKGTYQLKKKVSKYGYDCVQIKGKLKIKVTSTFEMMNGKGLFEGNGRGKVDLIFSPEEGIIVYKKGSSTITGDMEVRGGTRDFQGLVTTTNIGTITIKK